MSTCPWSKDSDVSDMLNMYADDEDLSVAFDERTKTAYSAGDDLAIAISEDVAVFRLSQPGGPVFSSKPDTIVYGVQQRTLERLTSIHTGYYTKKEMTDGLQVSEIKGSELKSWLANCFDSKLGYIYYG